jgi:hypothetical protein
MLNIVSRIAYIDTVSNILDINPLMHLGRPPSSRHRVLGFEVKLGECRTQRETATFGSGSTGSAKWQM